MAITPLTVTIDLNPSYKKIPAVYVSQLDNNLRELAITLKDGGVNYDVASSGYDVYIEGTKPDYKGFSYDVTDIGGTIVGSVITVPMQTQMTCVQGMVPTEIVLKSGTDRIGSANFLLVVERAGLAEDVDVSETDIPAYVDGAQQAAQAAEDAKDAAVDAKDTAVAVVASIPADYTTLSNDVDDLKSALLVQAWEQLSNSWVKATSSGNRYDMYLGQVNGKYKITLASGIWGALRGFTTSDYSGTPAYDSGTVTETTEFDVSSATTGYYYAFRIGHNTSTDIAESDRANCKVYKYSSVNAFGNVDLLQFFELGSVNISSSGWTYSQNFKRVRTKKDTTLHIPAGVKIGLKDYTNARFYIGWVTSEGTHGSDGWRTSDYTTTVEGDYVFQLAERTNEQYQSSLYLASLFFGYQPQALPYSEANTDTLNKFKQLPITMTSGYLATDGTTGLANGTMQEVFSEFIPVESDTVIYCEVKHSEAYACWAAVVQYDSEKNMVGSRTTPVNNVTVDYYNFYIEPASVDVKYIRFSYRTYGDATANVYISNPVAVNKLLIDDSFTAVGMFNVLLNSNVKGINHRGYSDIAPENTLSAFKLSKKKGFNYVETDVRFTSDGVAVLLHDDSINRTARNSDGTELSSTVNIADITYAQALTYDFGIYKGNKYAGTTIPTFTEFMTLCRAIGLHPYIELKAGGADQIYSLVDIVKNCGMLNNVTWVSFNDTYLSRVKERNADSRLGFLTSTITETKISTASALKNNVNEVFIDSSDTSTTAINLCKTADIPVEAWTVNNRTTLLNLDPYFTGVTSDRLNAGYELYLANV